MLAGFSVFGLTILVDIASGILATSIPWLSQYGFFAFVLSIALVMGERHSRLFREIIEAEARLKKYSRELQDKNEELVKLIDIGEELAAARRIQQSNLPSRLPEIPGIDMAKALCEKANTAFLAAGYVLIDLQGMSLVHANAGHQPLPVYKKTGGNFF